MTTVVWQRRHSWPAPWPVDNGQSNGRYGGGQDPYVTPACKYRPSPRHLESSGRNNRSPHRDYDEDSGRSSKRQRRHYTKQVEDDRWTPKSAGSHRKRSHD